MTTPIEGDIKTMPGLDEVLDGMATDTWIDTAAKRIFKNLYEDESLSAKPITWQSSPQVTADGIYQYMAAINQTIQPWLDRANIDYEAVADVLDAAHDLLLTGGWVQAAHGARGEHCAATAITDQTSVRSYVAESYAREALAHHLGLKGPGWIPKWNDAAKRTIDDVLDAFRGAAKALRNGEIDLTIPPQ